MGAVSDHLRGLVERQVKEHGLVVWFDPEGHYRDFVDGLSLPDTAIEACRESLIELRRRTEPYLGAAGDSPPRLVVYVPRSEADTRDSLAELTAPGIILRPGDASINRNTRLGVVAKNALRPALGAAQATTVEKDAEAGRMSLADLDLLGERQSTVISLIFGTAHPRDVALKLLGDTNLDAAVAGKDAVPDLANLLDEAFGSSLPKDGRCDGLRASLARHVLATEFIESIPGSVPTRLSFVKTAKGEAADACAGLAREWRNRRDLKESYANHADRVEAELNLARIGDELDLEGLSRCETFAATELSLQTAVEEWCLAAVERTSDEWSGMRVVIEGRLQSFRSSWPERYPDIHPRWLLIQAAAEVAWAAADIESGLKTLGGGPEEILAKYAGGLTAEEPWCDLDAHHRSLERRNLDFARSVHDEHPVLDKLVAYARQRYRVAGEALSEHFLRALRDARFEVSGVPHQTETFASRVAPALESGGKVAYLLVDSLRYEMARDLGRRLEKDYEVRLSAALAAVPTITEVGMAALMPGAELGAEVVRVSKGNLGLKIGDDVLGRRQDRIEYLKRHLEPSRSVYETKLEDLFGSPRKAKQKAADADLVFVTSQEIDEQGELGSAAARRFMDDVISMLPRAVHALADLGCETIILAADHGYLFADELGTDTKIDPPGGKAADLHRRSWVGVGGAEEPSYLRFPLSQMNLGEELHVAVPWGFGAFKVAGGAAAYFHGGMAPQEMVVPILSIGTKASSDSETSADIDWEIDLNSRKISTRFITVLVGGRPASLLDTALPRVRVEARVDGAVVSETVSAAYDYSESAFDVGLRLVDGEIETNTVTLMIDPDDHPEARSGTASIHLLDGATGVELARREGVETDISV